ncbi:MAG: phage tail protein [Burkholderiales bacterium]|nr:phage tail protein [Burkholderiales bacterium]
MADPFLGEIRLFAGNYAPVGWLLCAGQTVSISQYEALYALLGTTYGGNGTTSFGLPNLSEKLAIGQGSGPGLTSRVLGQTCGAAAVTLTPTQLPLHTHVIQASTDVASTITPGATLSLGAVSPPSKFYDNGEATAAATKAFSSLAFSTEGGNVPHDNLMPSLSLSYIIATAGIFPQQS